MLWRFISRSRASRTAFGTVAGLALSLSAAAAADLGNMPPPARTFAPAPAPVSRTVGCYAGVLVEGVVSHPAFENIPVPGTYSELFAKGFRGGGVVGCDVFFQSNTFLGVDLTMTFGSMKGTHAVGFSMNIPFEATPRVRLGYMLDPGVAVYVAGGPTVGYMKTTDAVGVTNNGYIWGGQIAVGFEWWFTRAWRLRGEYAYTYYGSDSIVATGFPLARMNPTEHAARLGFIYGFN